MPLLELLSRRQDRPRLKRVHGGGLSADDFGPPPEARDLLREHERIVRLYEVRWREE